MKKINEDFKSFLLENSSAFFADLKSLIEQDDDFPYQILTLNKPSDEMLDLMKMFWQFESSKVVLIYNCEKNECHRLLLKFNFLLPGDTESTQFNFENFSQIKRQGDQIILTQKHHGSRGYPEYLDVAIFDANGKVISVWKIDSNYHDQNIDSFRDLGGGRWLVKFESKESEKTLVLLTLYNYKEYELFFKANSRDYDHLANSDLIQIQTWFSNENGKSNFFILANSFRCFVYSLSKDTQPEEYNKMTGIIASAKITDFKVVQFEGSFAVEFFTDSDSCGKSNFFLSFEPKN